MAIFHTFRSDGFGGTKSKKLTPISAIKFYCKECMGFAPKEEIDDCPSELCPLYPFRLGKDPSIGTRRTKSACHSNEMAPNFKFV